MTNDEFEDLERLEYRMSAEGFDYCFDGYSDWTEIKDIRFHELRKLYLQPMNELKTYVHSLVENERITREEFDD